MATKAELYADQATRYAHRAQEASPEHGGMYAGLAQTYATLAVWAESARQDVAPDPAAALRAAAVAVRPAPEAAVPPADAAADLRRRIDRTLDYTDELLRLPDLHPDLAVALRAVHNGLCTPAAPAAPPRCPRCSGTSLALTMQAFVTWTSDATGALRRGDPSTDGDFFVNLICNDCALTLEPEPGAGTVRSAGIIDRDSDSTDVPAEQTWGDRYRAVADQLIAAISR